MARSSQAQEPESHRAEDLTSRITPANRVASSGSLNSLGQASDPEGAERPVREKLKKTSIAGLSKEVLSDSDHEMSGASDTSKSAVTKDDNNEEPRGRLRKKRSFEDMGGEGTEKQGRKRSRDVTLTGQPEVTKRKTSGEKGKNGTIKEHSSTSSSSEERSRKGAMLSPKGKRNREAFENEDDKPPAEVKDSSATEKKAAEKASADEPKTKRHRDSNSPEPEEAKASNTKIPQSSGFANTSTTSPFAALAASKSPTPTPLQAQTSESAFKASGFGALATASTSGFGALASSSKPASPFGGTTATSKPVITGLTSSTPSAFGGLSSTSENKSPFAAAGSSGFGTLGGGGFGGGFGGAGSKLTSFGGGSGPKIIGLSDKPAKPFGAAKEEKDEEEGSGDEDGDGDKDKVLSPTNEEDEKDERFFEQDVETGEENEETIFVCRAKLYNFVKVTDTEKGWKERGLGNLKVNVHKQSLEEVEEKAPKKARFVMRADGSHRVVLNSPIQKELKVGDVKGDKPSNGYVLFMGTIDGKELEMLQLKLKQPNAEALWEKVTSIQKDM